MININGRGNITAEIVADSINHWGDRLTTFRLHYPRFIHAELMTHRMFSRNASSSRAIPVTKMMEQVQNDPAMPIHWGLNKPGMQADEEWDFETGAGVWNPVVQWKNAAQDAVDNASVMYEKNIHKQVTNRLLEPFQFMNVMVSATDFNNFFGLRVHPDAQPEIQELASVMLEAYETSEPELISPNELHCPYVDRARNSNGDLEYFSEGELISPEDAMKISASCAAQVSYRNLDTSLEKAISIYDKLVGMEPKHASPFEHVAISFSEDEYMIRKRAHRQLSRDLSQIWSQEIAAEMAEQALYCGNFKGWTQMRKTMENENIRYFGEE